MLIIILFGSVQNSLITSQGVWHFHSGEAIVMVMLKIHHDTYPMENMQHTHANSYFIYYIP